MRKHLYAYVACLVVGFISAVFVVVNTDIPLEQLRTVALTVAAVVQTSFVLFYATFPWWKQFLGRALFAKAVTLMLIVDFAALSRWFDFGANDRIFIVLYATLTVGITYQFSAFIRVRLSNRESEVSGNAPATHRVKGRAL